MLADIIVVKVMEDWWLANRHAARQPHIFDAPPGQRQQQINSIRRLLVERRRYKDAVVIGMEHIEDLWAQPLEAGTGIRYKDSWLVTHLYRDKGWTPRETDGLVEAFKYGDTIRCMGGFRVHNSQVPFMDDPFREDIPAIDKLCDILDSLSKRD